MTTMGPWAVVPVASGNGRETVQLVGAANRAALMVTYEAGEEGAANARLAAAAPTLAEALEKAADTFADVVKMATMLRKTELAGAMAIAESHARAALRAAGRTA